VASEAILDFERLLQPISEAQPCGENLSSDPLMQDIKNWRDESSKSAPESSVQAEARFDEIIRATDDALATRTKDLALAAYLTEALLREHGFVGLRDGVHLLHELLERYWDGVHPVIERDSDGNEDLEARGARFDLLGRADKLPTRVRLTALLPSKSDEPLSWNFWKSRQVGAKRETETPDEYAQRQLEAEQRAKLFDEQANALSRGDCVSLRDDINASLEETKRLRALVDRRLGQSARSLQPLEEAIGDCQTLVEAILKTKPEPIEETAVDAEGNPIEGGSRGPGTGPLKSRQDALARLAEVAVFFKQTEPHSPISYLVQRAARWGTMSLQELMVELIKDEATRGQIGELLDFQQGSGSSEG